MREELKNILLACLLSPTHSQNINLSRFSLGFKRKKSEGVYFFWVCIKKVKRQLDHKKYGNLFIP